MGAAVKSASSENGQLDPEPDAEALSALSAAPLFLGRVSAPPSSSPSDEELEHAPKRRAWPCPAPPPVLGSLCGWALGLGITLLFQPAAS